MLAKHLEVWLPNFFVGCFKEELDNMKETYLVIEELNHGEWTHLVTAILIAAFWIWEGASLTQQAANESGTCRT